ncbi:MAG: chemotaxis protein CheV [Phycisphaerales bacterium]|nr:chemotaxis protein CheV [Phycisphaerales bacterium]
MTSEIRGITGDILLDAGTNELEVLVFRLRGGTFGVNVAKVREVIRPVRTIAAPHQHSSVLGMFNIRGAVLPVVDLARHLNLPQPEKRQEGRVIITEFNGQKTGFLVDGVEQIYRVSWDRVRPSPSLALMRGGGQHLTSTTTGIIEIKGRLVLMLDFESVADAILTERRLHIDRVDNPMGVDRASKRVILAEDSPFMRQLMRDILIRSGYERLEVYSDGEQAWNAIQEPGPAIHAIISDIEMPRMDGLHLTRRIKASPAHRDVPVVLFSSLVSQDNLKKGQQVGADVQIPKPELQELVLLVDRVVTGQTARSEAPVTINLRDSAAA